MTRGTAVIALTLVDAKINVLLGMLDERKAGNAWPGLSDAEVLEKVEERIRELADVTAPTLALL